MLRHSWSEFYNKNRLVYISVVPCCWSEFYNKNILVYIYVIPTSERKSFYHDNFETIILEQWCIVLHNCNWYWSFCWISIVNMFDFIVLLVLLQIIIRCTEYLPGKHWKIWSIYRLPFMPQNIQSKGSDIPVCQDISIRI